MRTKSSINQDWLYIADFSESYTKEGFSPDGNWEPVGLPHTSKELPYNCFSEEDYQFISTYRREIAVPSVNNGDRIFVDFEGVMTAAEVFINGQFVTEHLGGYTPFYVDITDFATPGETAVLTVKVDSTERDDIPPFGKVIDYLTYGGIYREVHLRVVPAMFIENVFARPRNILDAKKEMEVRLFLLNTTVSEVSRDIEVTIKNEEGGVVAAQKASVKVSSGRLTSEVVFTGLDVKLWEPESPVQYIVDCHILGDESEADFYTAKCGFRTAEFTDKGFLLNGKSLKIRGLNRHQAYPYVGYAMPKREQRREADRLKYDLGLNLVRTSHYPQSRHFLDRCDEIGLLVFEEIPGWQHIGEAKWKEVACENVREMIRTDWNRPSIILWGVRINESQDDHDFYTDTNRIAHELDDTRQTGGVRYIEKSELLEDVYTMNDFVHSGQKTALKTPKKVVGKKGVPYIVTEHNGHMFPTKRFDQEERLVEHATRHTRVLNAAGGIEGISGAIGWCAWDYNTHREFGSGDRICYHGVADMFRISKWAGAAYSSQAPASQKLVMEAASLFAKGERSAARVLPIMVFTNCDELVLYKNGNAIGTYSPARDEYPHLDHPPVILRDLIGRQLEDLPYTPRERVMLKNMLGYVMEHGQEKLKPWHYIKLGLFMRKNKLKFDDLATLFMKYNAGWGEEEDTYALGGIINGEEVINKVYGSAVATDLKIKADDLELESGDWDTTRVEFRLVDQYGNIMPFINETIRFEIEGPGSVIGPEFTALTGGVIACWIKTNGMAGTIKVKGICSRFESETVELTVK